MDLRVCDPKRYTDVATQTSPFTSPLIAPACPASPVTSFFTATSLAPDCNPIERSPELEGLDECFSIAEYTPTSESSKSEIYPPHPPSLPSCFGLQRYTSTGSRLLPSNNRTVSLPETLCDEDLRLVLSQLIDNSEPESREKPRVVSMPESVHLHASPPTSPVTLAYFKSKEPSQEEDPVVDGHIYGDDDMRSNSSSPSTPRTIVMHSHSSDQFHTPSPPLSSCDSVEFTLEDPVCVPDSFLCGSISPPVFIPAVADKAVGVLEDDGWLTWANSPPRPIPALHGPSSLPYARCPSGAEGTIIGEPSSLPRMIWGLDPNDAVSPPHIPQPQQSRAVPIKPPVKGLNPGHGALQGPASIASTATTFVSAHIAPRFGNASVDYNYYGEPSRSLPVPTALGLRREEASQGDFRGLTRGSAGLGFIVSEEPIRLETRHERGMRDDDIMDQSYFHRMSAPNSMKGDSIELLSVKKQADNQHSPEVNSQEEYRHTSYVSGPGRGHPSNLVELLSSPVNLLDRAANKSSRISSVTPRLSVSEFTPNYLPTPPNSSSPQWSSVFSPLRNKPLSITGFSHNGKDISAGIRLRHTPNMANDELSEELRRFVFENMSPVSSASVNDALLTPRTPRCSAPNVFSTAHPVSASSVVGSPAHPPGLPIPQHIILSKALEPFDPLSAQTSPSLSSSSPSVNSYPRSTLSNPRSIPLSRLRQKRGAIKLATVPEEESAASEPHAHDGTLAPPTHAPLRLSLRTPSPLDDKFRVQSVEDKTAFGEELKLGQVRVKLPQSTNAHPGSARANLDSDHSITPQGSPKKKRLQRRKKLTKPVETAKVGFPLVSEGTVSFGSMNSSVTQDVRKDGGQLSFTCVPSVGLHAIGKV